MKKKKSEGSDSILKATLYVEDSPFITATNQLQIIMDVEVPDQV